VTTALWAAFLGGSLAYTFGRRWMSAPGPAAGLRARLRAVKLVPALALATLLWPASPAFTAAFVCYALGDAFLLDKARYFVPGLAAFLVGHVVLVGALLAAGTLPSAAGVAFGLVAGAWMLRLLWPGLSRSKRVAVPAYTATLVALLALCAPLGPAGALGAAVFLLSDALLAFQAFRRPLPAGDLAVSGTYFVALALLAWQLLSS